MMLWGEMIMINDGTMLWMPPKVFRRNKYAFAPMACQNKSRSLLTPIY